MQTLNDMLQRYADLLEKKDELAAATKENNAALKDIQADIAAQMIEEDCTGYKLNGVTYFMRTTEKLNWVSENKIAAAGLDKLQVLKDNGLGNLIYETVNNGSVKNALQEAYDSPEEWPEDIAKICYIFEEIAIGHRKN